METYNLRINEKELKLRAPDIEAAVMKFSLHFNLTYCQNNISLADISIEGHKNPFVSRNITSYPPCEFLDLITRAEECEVVL